MGNLVLVVSRVSTHIGAASTLASRATSTVVMSTSKKITLALDAACLCVVIGVFVRVSESIDPYRDVIGVAVA